MAPLPLRTALLHFFWDGFHYADHDHHHNDGEELKPKSQILKSNPILITASHSYVSFFATHSYGSFFLPPFHTCSTHFIETRIHNICVVDLQD